MKNTRDLFRENLRVIISKRGVKLEDAAELCGVSLSFLNQLLSGKSAYSPETLDKICEGLKCTPADLFSQTSEESPKIIGRADSILHIQSRLTSLNEEQLGFVDGFIDDLLAHTASSNGLKKSTGND